MKVGLIDFDGKIPNLALMKISSFYKQQGAEVFLNDIPQDVDKVYCSVLFTWNKSKATKLRNAQISKNIGHGNKYQNNFTAS